MRNRPLRDSDIPILREIGERSGFPYPDFSDLHIKAVVVAVDSDDKPLGACVAKELIELYGYFDTSQSPTLKGEVLACLHQGMAQALRDIGYNSAEMFPPPEIAGKFSRRMERKWGWIKNWPSWTKHF